MTKIIKRYLLFSGSTYDEFGGWRDFEAAFDTLDEALLSQNVKEATGSPDTWYHIVDVATLEIVRSG
jgi:hypothetical protein